jgi:hypothetical protein
MKTLKIKLHATPVSYLQYECHVEAPDGADPEALIDLLHEAVDGFEFVEEDVLDGDWHPEGEVWTVAEKGKDEGLPRWRFVPGEDGTFERLS